MLKFVSGLLAVLAITAPVAAQKPAAAAAGLGGRVIAGVCLLSRDAVFANAKVAKAADDRLRQLAQEAQAEVDAERKPIEPMLQAYRSEQAKLTPDVRATRERTLAAQLQPIEAKSEQRKQELQATRAKALERISVELQPIIADLYRQRGCGLLLDRNSVVAGNMANDLTGAVVEGLDAKISTITFNREMLAGAKAPATAR